jgi:RNA polymerase sigma factor (TIGR02999 family)
MERESLDYLFSATYEELRRLARSVQRTDGSATLNPTALVNEAYLKLAASLRIRPESRLHFKRLAARAMRQVLVEAARRRQTDKRGASWSHVAFDEGLQAPAATAQDIVALDLALQQLARLSSRQAAMVECRFFAGLDIAETALVLGVSEATVTRDWRAARAWLSMELRPDA